jgi:hypothetical protein
MAQEYFQFYDGSRMGIKTAEGKIIIPAQYDFVSVISDELFSVQSGSRVAYLDKNGNTFLPFDDKYESYGNFTEGLARVRKNERWGYINKENDEVIPLQFHYADEFSNERAIVRNELGLNGAIDKKGNIIIKFKFKQLEKFENGYAKFGDMGTWGVINKEGSVIIEQQYSSIKILDDDKFIVQLKEGDNYKEGTLKIGGEILWNQNLDSVNEFNRKQREFLDECEALIEEMYSEGCPCAYKRFRDFIVWDQPISFIDEELLFSVFSKRLTVVENDEFECPKCKTRYCQKQEQYSAFLWVINIAVVGLGNFVSKGAEIMTTVPVALGFRGYNRDGLKKIYIQADITAVINYLKEE